MKAIVISSPDGPEVLQLQQVEDPELKDDKVLIKVQVSVLNRADTFQRRGNYPPPKGAKPKKSKTNLITDFPAGNGFSNGLNGPRTFDTKVRTGTFVWWIRASPLNRIGLDLDENLVVFEFGILHFL
ncbi:putative NADPH:quinone reductase [Fagus crenata]